MLYCTNCGCPLAEDANFCITCGAKVIRHNAGVRSLETAILETPGTYTQRTRKEIPLAYPETHSAIITLAVDAIVIAGIILYAAL